MPHHQVLIVGGGTAGITVAAMLLNQPEPPQVSLIEPSETHYYQPIWTLVGGGVFDKSVSARPMADYIPGGVNWIRSAVSQFDPDNNLVNTTDGNTHTYDALVVAAGIQLNWHAIPGLKESVGKAGSGVCSNYAFETVDSTFNNLKALKKGNAVFTYPNTPIKCGGAPLKITLLASDYWRRRNLLGQVKVHYYAAMGVIFAVKKYADSLNRAADRYGIQRNYMQELVEIKPDQQQAHFKHLETGEIKSVPYDMLHVTPPMGAPDFIKNSPLAGDGGWVAVDMYTTQHTRYPNVFSLGDCSNLPTSKTGAAIRKQAPVTTHNLLAYLNNQPLTHRYDGYTSCPLVTGYGSLIMAEFDYNKIPQETFPFDQSQERYSMYALKAYGLPQMYWHGMLKGREF